MATITIEDVPENIVNQYGIKLTYKQFSSFFRPKNEKEFSLTEYINSEEYKIEPKHFMNSEIFLDELKSKIIPGK